jgi:hypothetical protein
MRRTMDMGKVTPKVGGKIVVVDHTLNFGEYNKGDVLTVEKLLKVEGEVRGVKAKGVPLGLVYKEYEVVSPRNPREVRQGDTIVVTDATDYDDYEAGDIFKVEGISTLGAVIEGGDVVPFGSLVIVETGTEDQLRVGDVVKIIGTEGIRNSLEVGKLGTVVEGPDEDGDVVVSQNGKAQYVSPVDLERLELSEAFKKGDRVKVIGNSRRIQKHFHTIGKIGVVGDRLGDYHITPRGEIGVDVDGLHQWVAPEDLVKVGDDVEDLRKEVERLREKLKKIEELVRG